MIEVTRTSRPAHPSVRRDVFRKTTEIVRNEPNSAFVFNTRFQRRKPHQKLHASAFPNVYSFVGPFRIFIGLLAVSAFAADPALDTLLKGVENRYNKAKTLQVLFHEDYTPQGRPRRSESGTLRLRKPGRMRWDYEQPKGKIFVSDGKFLYLYTPSENKAEKMKLQASDDMRVPLAFLLGKLNFQKEFRNVKATQEGADQRIAAEPKSDNLPYS